MACIRCGGDGSEAGGGVHVLDRFICWDCERPGEDLVEIAERAAQVRDRIEREERKVGR